MWANWCSWLGRGSGVAPMSSTTIGPFQDGSGCTIAGRRTPGQPAQLEQPGCEHGARRARPRRPPARLPSRTRRMQLTTEESSRSRAARAGSSSCAISPGACTTSISGTSRTSGSSSDDGPHTSTRRSPRATASRAPATITSAPRSLPIASSATVTVVLTPRAARSRAPCTSCTWGTSGARASANRTASRRRQRSRCGTPW